MQLQMETRRVGDIVVVKCAGRIVAGEEVESLQRKLGDLLPHDRDFLLQMADVSFLDSSGIGALVRLHTRSLAAHGNLKLCCVSNVVADVLRLTRLNSLLEAYETEEAAITAFYARPRKGEADKPRGAAILCVEKSADALAYVREVLRRSGYDAITATNLPDAVVLLTAVKPRAVVVSAELRAFTGTRAADSFKRLSATVPVIELASDFCSSDAADAAQRLLDQVAQAAGHAQSTSA